PYPETVGNVHARLDGAHRRGLNGPSLVRLQVWRLMNLDPQPMSGPGVEISREILRFQVPSGRQVYRPSAYSNLRRPYRPLLCLEHLAVDLLEATIAPPHADRPGQIREITRICTGEVYGHRFRPSDLSS